MKEERQKAEACRKTGDYDTATRILKKMSALKEPQAAKYVEWAKKELIAVKAEPEKIRREAPAICRAVTQLLEKHDYDQAQQMLEGIPEFLRNEEMESLLRETLEVIDQLGVLEAEMDLASQDRDWRRAEKAAKQIVKLKPTSAR